LDKLNDDLQDVTRIMTKNMEELLWRGDSLDSVSSYSTSFHPLPMAYFSTGMSHLSTSLRSETEKYHRAARNINFQAMVRQYAPIAVIVFIVLILLWWRFA
jgi:vesicle transport protein SEC22